MTQDGARTGELILYIAQRSEGDPDFNEAKLYRILFYADFGLYARTGKSITGCEYRKNCGGPLPLQGQPLLDTLVASGDLAIAQHSYYGRLQQQPKALRDPDLSGFAGEEIAMVERALCDLRGRSATDFTDLAQRFIGWKITEPDGVIPYETALIDNGPMTEDEEQYALQLIAAGR